MHEHARAPQQPPQSQHRANATGSLAPHYSCQKTCPVTGTATSFGGHAHLRH